MTSRTIFPGRLLGLYAVLVPLSMALHKRQTIEAVTGLFRDPAMLFLLGLITLSAGLAMVLAHNIWTAGLFPAIVSWLGWSTLIKGLLFLFLSPQAASDLFPGTLRYEHFFYVYVAFSMAIGIGLLSRWSGSLRHRDGQRITGTPSPSCESPRV